MILKRANHKGSLKKKNLSQICSTNESELEIIIVDESITEENELESVHKSIITNNEKYKFDKTEHEESLLTNNPVINELRYFNLFE